MLRTIHLHGSLGAKYATEYVLDVETPAEAVRALCVQLPDFDQTIRAGEWRCIRGGFDDGLDCDEDLLHLRFGSLRDFHLVPAAVGAKSGGNIAKIILGIALIAASFIPGVQAFTIPILGHLAPLLFGMGAMMALGGISQLISPTPNSNNPTTFLFNGPVNTGQSGTVCPIVFGRVRAGSVTVSAGIVAEQIANGTYGATQTPIGGIAYSGAGGPIIL